LIGTRLSQELLRQAAEQHRRFAADMGERWMEHNTRMRQIIVRGAEEDFPPAENRPAGSQARQSGR
jgi:hypothetical protein